MYVNINTLYAPLRQEDSSSQCCCSERRSSHCSGLPEGSVPHHWAQLCLVCEQGGEAPQEESRWVCLMGVVSFSFCFHFLRILYFSLQNMLGLAFVQSSYFKPSDLPCVVMDTCCTYMLYDLWFTNHHFGKKILMSILFFMCL